MQRVHVIDSHTGGEPTRIVISGGPDLGSGSMAERLSVFRSRHDAFRSAVVNEPRGSDVIVGALLCNPTEPNAAAGVIFFNNVGYLGMCGHGTIGLMVTLAHLGRIAPGEHRIETPVGPVSATLIDSATVSLDNVPSYRYQQNVTVDVEGLGPVKGDIAWGGNWFFLVDNHGIRLDLSNVDQLTDVSWRIRCALESNHITGAGGQEIDHIELFSGNRNFVLCPGKAYDRSPCGTGTSAKLACLAADGKLPEGEIWRQQSIVGSIFEGSYRRAGDHIIPTIRGTAYVNAEATLLLNPQDPYCMGIPK